MGRQHLVCGGHRDRQVQVVGRFLGFPFIFKIKRRLAIRLVKAEVSSPR